MNKLFELALECAKNGHGATLVFNKEKARPEFVIHIGSKTGDGSFYEENNEIILETRFQKKTVIQSFDDIGEEAYSWFLNYRNREPFSEPDSAWKEYFVEKGYLKKVTKTFYE